MAKELTQEAIDMTLQLANRSVGPFVSEYSKSISSNDDKWFGNEINALYQTSVDDRSRKEKRKDKKKYGVTESGDAKKIFDVNVNNPEGATWVWNNDKNTGMEKLKSFLTKKLAKEENDENSGGTGGTSTTPDEDPRTPFDRRLDRLWSVEDPSGNTSSQIITPFNAAQTMSALYGWMPGNDTVNAIVNPDLKQDAIDKAAAQKDLLENNPFNRGAAALMNEYALTTLYGSEGGKMLVNKRNERKWYDIDSADPGISANPTTSTLISWGGADPHLRTPYTFTDFVFSKHWKKVENNRLITLRRYAAPIYDNLKFPGMTGETNSSGIDFPPMATAVTYFGEDTENSLNSLLKFTTGVKWGEVTSSIHEVTMTTVPDVESGPGGDGTGFFSAMSEKVQGLSKILNVGAGQTDSNFIMNKGALPPDPYKDGPYENKIQGPINRIDSTKKREAGLDFKWDGLKIVFEYVARPVGGVNPKAVLLDIMSNFMILGSATAVFFGGQYRFMSDPAKYPFMGGDEGMEAWYSGKPLKWAEVTAGTFSNNIKSTGLGDLFTGFDLTGFVNKLMKGEGLDTKLGQAGSNIAKNYMAEKSAGAIPYLKGMKALLTGEPVGDWHVTIGNPLNPIAMIGNLICENIEVEFGEELGPDDFPTEMKVTVNLDHGMPRDRDAIQSVFNRGMGRIYSLPDHFKGAADYETGIDEQTGGNNRNGEILPFFGIQGNSTTDGGDAGKAKNSKVATSSEQSVWGRRNIVAVSPNANLAEDGAIGVSSRSTFRSVDWIALNSLK